LVNNPALDIFWEKEMSGEVSSSGGFLERYCLSLA
jgi:hypothetical protein